MRFSGRLNKTTGVGKDKTILDENRNITFFEDYADGQSIKTRSVSFPIDSVKIGE
ncbi:MAG: hypothetical protein WAK17_18070 [Candidatus Nitrosopolaris sp.]